MQDDKGSKGKIESVPAGGPGAPSKAGLVYHSLRERIEQGDYIVGARLPAEPALAAEFEVSRHIVQDALNRLVRQNMVERRKGSGTYVTNRLPLRPMTLSLEDVWSHGLEMSRSTEMRLVGLQYEIPAPHIASALRLSRKERVQTTTRVRACDGVPFSYVITRVPERLARLMSEESMQTRPILDLFDEAGIVANWSTQSIGATLAGPVIAGYLGVEIGAALLTLTRATFDADGEGIQHLEGYYRPDMFNFQMDLVRRADSAEPVWDLSRKAAEPKSAEPECGLI